MQKIVLFVLISGFIVIGLGCSKKPSDQPNVLVIYFDDMGYGDKRLGSDGSSGIPR
jgi:hypothetical protein